MTYPLLTVEYTDPIKGFKGYLAIDHLINGVCAGGWRIRPGLTCAEVVRLAQTMTDKFALIDLPIGGAKCGMDYDSTAPDKIEAMKRFAEAIAPYLHEVYGVGEDLGTREEEVAEATRHVGLAATVEAISKRLNLGPQALQRLAQGFALRVDEFPMVEFVTGYGIAHAAREAAAAAGLSIAGASVAIQGFGSVGGSAAHSLLKLGAKIVAVGDVQGTLFNADGLDVKQLLAARDKAGTLDRARLPRAYQRLGREEILYLPVDILIPAAVADVIRADNADRVRARVVVEAANIPVTTEGEEKLYQRGVVYVPDFVANAGATAFYGALMLGRMEPTVDSVLEGLTTRIGGATRQVLQTSRQEKISPRLAATRAARQKLAAI